MSLPSSDFFFNKLKICLENERNNLSIQTAQSCRAASPLSFSGYATEQVGSNRYKSQTGSKTRMQLLPDYQPNK